jgi:hypothetical protein
VFVQDYSLIGGLTGVGRYLLFFREDKEISPLLNKVLDYLIKLSEEKTINDQFVPRWYIPNKNILFKRDKEFFERGYMDLGVAQGIAGPLALLSLSKIYGVYRDGLIEAIQKMTNRILSFNRMSKNMEELFPNRVGLSSHKNEFVFSPFKGNWANGYVGISWALWLAGKGLEDKELIQKALRIIKSIDINMLEQREVISPTFAHGLAGVIYVLHRFYVESGDEEFIGIRDKLLNFYDKDAPFKYYDIVKIGNQNKKIVNAGLFDGVAGVLLVLSSLLKDTKLPWDIVFLLN